MFPVCSIRPVFPAGFLVLIDDAVDAFRSQVGTVRDVLRLEFPIFPEQHTYAKEQHGNSNY